MLLYVPPEIAVDFLPLKSIKRRKTITFVPVLKILANFQVKCTGRSHVSTSLSPISDALGEQPWLYNGSCDAARKPAWTKWLFFAKDDPEATWLDDLKPAFGEKEFFFKNEYRDISSRTKSCQASSGQQYA